MYLVVKKSKYCKDEIIEIVGEVDDVDDGKGLIERTKNYIDCKNCSRRCECIYSVYHTSTVKCMLKLQKLNIKK